MHSADACARLCFDFAIQYLTYHTIHNHNLLTRQSIYLFFNLNSSLPSQPNQSLLNCTTHTLVSHPPLFDRWCAFIYDSSIQVLHLSVTNLPLIHTSIYATIYNQLYVHIFALITSSTLVSTSIICFPSLLLYLHKQLAVRLFVLLLSSSTFLSLGRCFCCFCF